MSRRRKITLNLWAVTRPVCWWKGHDFELRPGWRQECRRCLAGRH